MANDKKTVGITATNAAALAHLVSAGHFSSELDAAKFAMAYAIKAGVRSGATDGAETKWNVGSIDPDGSMRSLLEALFPESTVEPYRLAEYLMNEGIKALGEQGGRTNVYDMLFPASEARG
jgi:hypothetical protein